MEKKGFLIVNGFLSSASFSALYGLFSDAAKKYRINLILKKNSELLFDGASGKPLFDDTADFVLFWDKDICLAKQLEALGFKVYNCAESIALCDDKALTHMELAKHNIAMPKTVIAPMTFPAIGYTDKKFLSNTAEYLGFPLVVKERCGSFGQQVYLANNMQELEALTLQKAGIPLIFQEFIKTSFARDIRLFVVGNKVIASMLRKNNDGDFRANVANGGITEKYIPTDEETEMAISVCKALSLSFAGVDILFGENDTPLLCEVNSNAHFKGLLDCTGINAAEAIIKYITDNIK